jgi:hypothetical protein
MMNQHEIAVILKKHQEWLNGANTGESAALRNANLYGANLYGANLYGASLRNANLYGASLRNANLYGASLRDADLRNANLYGADLRNADLRNADLRDADLRDANLYGANLYGASLRNANLYGANLRNADLRDADLRDANLRDANLYGADLTDLQKTRTQICPQSGSFTAFKKLHDGVIAKLQIPATAKRSNAPGGRKCRASKAKVISFLDCQETEIFSQWDKTFKYTVGEIVEPKEAFNINWWEECASGIHFYLSKEEAEAH